MTLSHSSITYDSHEKTFCSGLGHLQRNGEFVDMTIAADGHMVKVHQIVIALSSPYLKDLIKSIPSQHPVVFLNNVTHEILCWILEYVYTGEALIPNNKLGLFLNAAKALHIQGLENLHQTEPDNLLMGNDKMSLKRKCVTDDLGAKRLTKTLVSSDNKTGGITSDIDFLKEKDTEFVCFLQNTSNLVDDSFVRDDDDFDTESIQPNFEIGISPGVKERSGKQVIKGSQQSSNLQYTMSQRNNLQIILNRFLYNMSPKGKTGIVIRWRCVEYRKKRCLAYVETKKDMVINRKNIHNHSFHDKKIIKKIENNLVFATLKTAEENLKI